MAKIWSFGSQKASVECPEVPRGGATVFGESLHDATMKLAKALKSDPQLKKPHPEFEQGGAAKRKGRSS